MAHSYHDTSCRVGPIAAGAAWGVIRGRERGELNEGLACTFTMFRPSKRQRRENDPICWMDCEDLTAVPSPTKYPPIVRTTLASKNLHDLFLDRFEKEIVKHHGFSLSSIVSTTTRGNENMDLPDKLLLKQRVRIGINTGTRALEAACKKGEGNPVPLLVVVAAEDVSPVNLPLVHFPVLCDQCQAPLLLLPGMASFALGRLVGANKVSVMTFMPSSGVSLTDAGVQANRRLNDDLDSFVRFILSKLP